MSLKELVKIPLCDVESWRMPFNFELAGKSLDIAFDGGETVKLTFAAFPEKKLFIGDIAQGLAYDCVKADDHVLFVSYELKESLVAYAIDTAKELVTRVYTGEHLKSSFSFGAYGDGADKQGFTDDLDGNTIVWSLGKQENLVLKTVYGGGTAAVGDYAVSDFKAVKISDNTYLQNAIVTAASGDKSVNLLANFWNLTCVGSVFGVSTVKGVTYKLFGGHGRNVSE
jgi:hypothetical protein